MSVFKIQVSKILARTIIAFIGVLKNKKRLLLVKVSGTTFVICSQLKPISFLAVLH